MNVNHKDFLIEFPLIKTIIKNNHNRKVFVAVWNIKNNYFCRVEFE